MEANYSELLEYLYSLSKKITKNRKYRTAVWTFTSKFMLDQGEISTYEECDKQFSKFIANLDSETN